MKKKIIVGFLFMLLMVATILPVASTQTSNNEKEENFTFESTQESTNYNANWWPMFRHDSGNSGCSSSMTPETKIVNWKQSIPDDIYSSVPIVYNDKLYLGTGWYYDFLDLPNMTRSSMFEEPYWSEIIEKLTTYKDEYYGGIYCLDADSGSAVWDYPMYAPNDPAIVDGKVYLTDLDVYSYYSSLYCLDADTGDEIFKKMIYVLALSPTIIADDKIYIGCIDLFSDTGIVRCFDLNGNSIWDYQLPPYETTWFSAPAVHDGNIYFITSDYYSYYYGRIYCLNAETGQFKWSKTISLFWYYLLSSNSPSCSDGKVFVVDFDIYSYFGHLRCFDAENGNPLWTYNLGLALSFATPAICEDAVFVTALDLYAYNSWLYKINSNDGTLIWKKPIPGFAYWWFLSMSPICSQNKVFVCPTDYYDYSSSLYCLDKEDGSLTWKHDLDYWTLCSPSVADERVYIADYMGNVYAFGEPLKIGEISGGLLSVTSEIINNDESDLTDISWTIQVTGGFLGMINRHSQGDIPSLPASDIELVQAFPIIGLGKIYIEVTATMPGMSMIKKSADGFVLGPLVIIDSK